MSARFTLRLAAAAGWIAFAGVVGGFIVIPTLLAGQPPTIWTPLDEAQRYFAHPEFVGLYAVVGILLAGVPIVPFGLGLRQVTGEGSERAAVVAGIGFSLLLATVPVYVVANALGAGLATVSGNASSFGALHQVYELLYNGAADVLEGAWIGAFSFAMLLGPNLRWAGWLGIALAVSRWVKALIPITTLVPDAVTAVSGILFLAWFLVMVVALTRRAMRPMELQTLAGAPA